ncbi:MAG: DUF4058 family protein [Trichodesmium sp. MO_231.B1]|nr:DUF4058 family protein [Trichodesmium sp. MO_231.B1]
MVLFPPTPYSLLPTPSFLEMSIYDVDHYDLKIDYAQKQVPKLSENDAAWADTWLRQEGIR